MSDSAGKKKSNACYYLPLAGAALGALSARLAWRRLLRRGLPPQYDRVELPGLNYPVELLRDTWGVPHIYARSAHDLFYAQGYVHAQDRLFQMDIVRRVGLGRISELIGRSGLVSDRIARYFGWRKAAQAQVDGADAYVQEVMRAYSAGVNAYIKSQPLPPEFALLRYKPQPWGLPDTAAIGAVLAWGLSVNWETELLRMLLLQSLGPEKAFDLTPLAADDYLPIVPGTAVDERLARDLIDTYRRAMANLPFKTAAASSGGAGSNNWVVNGDHTLCGRPLLSNDPHLPPTYPALWYENHLAGGEYHVTGFTMPGIPGVVIGHNAHIAWGFTNAFPDIQDVYVERFHEHDDTLYEVNGEWVEVDIQEEVIQVRGSKPLVEKVRYTRHGPVFSDLLPAEERALALRWASHSTHNHMRSVFDMNRASNWGKFRDALRPWGFPSQNIVFAAVDGDIGYMMPGKVPLRAKGSGLVPVPGWHDEFDWTGWIPFEELPTLHNPKSGKIVTANNRVTGASYPYLLTSEWLPDYRARRITQLLARDSQQTTDSHARIQADTVSLRAREFLALALPLVQETMVVDEEVRFAMQLLAQWDGDMRADLVVPSLYAGWLVHFSQMVVRQAVGLELAEELFKSSQLETYQTDPFLEHALALSIRWLEEGSPEWVGDIQPLLLPALRKTIRLLQREFGEDPANWLWGNLHYIRHEHPLTRVPGLGLSWKTEDIPVGGDGETVNQADIMPHFPPNPVKIIASCRMIMDVGEWDNCISALPGGQSGNPVSPHYEDGLLDWRDGRYHPMLFSREKIEAATETILMLTPEGQ